MLSSNANQNVTYHCRKSVAHYDAVGKNYKKALTFATSDEREFVAAKSRLQYKVSLDECQVRADP